MTEVKELQERQPLTILNCSLVSCWHLHPVSNLKILVSFFNRGCSKNKRELVCISDYISQLNEILKLTSLINGPCNMHLCV